MSTVTPHTLWYRMRALVRKRDVERDVDDELAFHIDMETERLVASGASPSDARARAVRAFGDPTRVREECVDERGVRPLEDFAQDLRIGTRMLRRSRGTTAVSVITLAVGIAAATTIFSIVDGVLLKPFPYDDAGRLVTVRQRSLRDGTLDDVAPGNFVDWSERTRTIERLSAAVPYGMDHRTDEGMTTLRMWLVSSDFFALLGTPARHGRTFHPGEFVPGSDRVIVLGDATWRARFGGDSSIVGQTLTLDGAPFTVVGVMPRTFAWPPGHGGDVWAPLTISEEDRQTRSSAWWVVLGRLRPGTTVDGARREMSAIAEELAATYPATNRDTGIEITPLEDALLGDAREALTMLAAAVVLLLLIACANVANITLGRSIGRAREFALRSALGAGPARLARQMVTEVLVVAALGTVLGVIAATWAVDTVRALSPRDIPRIDELTVDMRVLGFAAVTAVVVAVLAGAVPAIWVARGNLSEALKEGGRTVTSGRRTRAIRATLAIGQVTLATMLLVGAGLLVRSLESLLRVERGYDTSNVAVSTVQIWDDYRDPDHRVEFVRQALDRLSGLRGVSAVGVTSSLPLAEAIGADAASYILEDQPRPAASQWPSIHAVVVGGAYFDALRARLDRGRRFDGRDRANTTPVAIVNAAFARRHYPGADPLGRRLRVRFYGVEAVREIVGIVGDMRHEGLHASPSPTVFLPYAQIRSGALTFVMRSETDPASALRAMRAELAAMNPTMPVEDGTTLDDLLRESIRARRFNVSLLVAFSLAALVLAAVGVYGVVSHATAERTHEIGVRVALGAQPGSIIGTVVRAGLAMVGVGVVLGAIGAAAGSRALSEMLFQTTAHDIATYVGAALVILATALVATAVPAVRAMRVEPTEALRG